MRQLITFDRQGNLIGEFPHDPLAGFQASRRGLRRRLMNADEVASMTPERALQIAQQRYDVKEKEIREAAFIVDEKQRQREYRKKNISLSDAAKSWLEHVKVTNSPRTLKYYSHSIALYIKHVGDHRLRDFSRDHNIAFIEQLQNLSGGKAGGLLSVNTQHMHLRHLNNFLRWAYDNELLDKRHNLKKPKLPQKDMEVFSVDQLRILKNHLLKKIESAEPGRPMVNAVNLYRAFMLATNSLMRIGPIAHLPLDAIDMQGMFIRIRDVPERDWKNKGSKWPNKPISQRFYEYLESDLANRNPAEFWFLDDGTGKPWYAHTDNISRAMSEAIAECGLPKVKPFHWAMRAAMITWLLNNGESPQKVQQLADHADIQTTMKYYNTREASQRDAVERLPEI